MMLTVKSSSLSGRLQVLKYKSLVENLKANHFDTIYDINTQ